MDITDKKIDEAINKLSSSLDADKLEKQYIKFLSKDNKFGKYKLTYGDYYYFIDKSISPNIEILIDNLRSVFGDDFFKRFVIEHNKTLLDRVAQIIQYGLPNLDNIYSNLETTMNINITISAINIKNSIEIEDIHKLDRLIAKYSAYGECDIWIDEDQMLEPARCYDEMFDFIEKNNFIII